MALTDQTFVIETVAASGADHASLNSFASSFNTSSLDLVTDGNVAVAMVDSFVDTGGRATFTGWTTDSDNIIILTVPLSLPLDTGAGTFTQGETITGGTSGATAMVIDQNATYHGVGGTNSLTVSFLGGVFVDGETVTGGTSAATGTVNGSLDASLYHGGISRDSNGGTGYQLDGQTTVSFGVIRLLGGSEYTRGFGLEVKRGASGGIRQAGQSVKTENDVQQWWNCIVHNDAGSGFQCNTTETLFVNCLSYANTGDGFSGVNSGNEGAAYFCLAYNNGGDGFDAAGRRIMRNCVSGGNTGDDFKFETNEDYCLSSDTTAAGLNSKASVTFTTTTSVTGAIFTNLTAGSEDFTPKAATGGATQELEDAGVAVAAYKSDGALNERSDPPELGMFELIAAGTTITGAGAIQAGPIQMSGSALREITSAGALSAGVITVSGIAERTLTGSGAVDIAAALVSGTGTLEGAISGTGALVLSPAAVAGTGSTTPAITGTGALTMQAALVAGTGERTLTGTGDIAVSAVAVSGAVFRALQASGALVLPAVSIDGTGAREAIASGALVLGATVVLGSATLGAIIQGRTVYIGASVNASSLAASVNASDLGASANASDLNQDPNSTAE